MVPDDRLAFQAADGNFGQTQDARCDDHNMDPAHADAERGRPEKFYVSQPQTITVSQAPVAEAKCCEEGKNNHRINGVCLQAF